jgi:iron complex outermembrane receptor protein
MIRINFAGSRSWRAMPALLSLMLACGAGPLHAQQAGGGESVGLEEVVVTAQKRSENLQTVPVSVTALTANQLQELKLDTSSALATQIPNLQVNGIVGEGSPIFSLRGVSMFDYSLNQSSPVGAYIDEVYKGNFVLFGVEMYDLERVEVLRGPQGTLYGKNTTGGAINFITHKPGFDTQGYLRVGLGNYGRTELEGALQGALVPGKLAVRLAVTGTTADGFIHNVLPGKPDMEGVDQYGLRLSLLYQASDDLKFTLRLSKSHQNPYNYAIIAGRVAAAGIGYVGDYRTVDGTATGVPLKDDEVAMNYAPRRQQDNKAAELTTEWALGSGYALTAITSWDKGSLFNPEGTDGSRLDIFKIPYIGRTQQFAQDVRIATTGGGPLNYILGAYYQRENIFNSTENQFYNFLDNNGDNVVNFHDCLDTGIIPAGFDCRYYNEFDQRKTSWSVYGDGSYKLSDRVKLRSGLRYNHDTGEQYNALDQLRGPDEVPVGNILGNVYYGDPGFAAGIGQRFSQSTQNSAVTGRLGLDFTPATDKLMYLSYSRGYRAAAFNAQFLFTAQDFSQVKPETIDSFEAGFKTSWADNRVQINGALFHYQYKNQQIIDVDPVTLRQPLENLGKSKIDGGELELVMRPVRDFTARLGMGFLDTKVQEGHLTAMVSSGNPIGSIAGQHLPNAPAVSGTLAGDWQAWTGSAVALRLHLDANYAAKQYLALPQEEAISQSAYTLLNARVALASVNDHWNVGLWANNLTDKFYLTNAVDLQGLLGMDYRHRGLPRMYGLDATFRF